MQNRDIDAAWAYHNGTKHSYQSVRAGGHYLDWENQPLSFKIYPQLAPLPLDPQLSSSAMPALATIGSPGERSESSAAMTSRALAEMLFLAAGITRRRKYPGGEILFRAAACTGALYHIDLYVVCADLDGLDAGVYQFSPQDFALRKLRAGDFRPTLVRASGVEPSVADAQCVIVSASTFWRNAWKYQARAYRHCYWDNGTLLANLLATASARKISAKLVLGFVDATLHQLLALDSQREAALSLIALGHDASLRGSSSLPTLPELALETVPLSKREVDYPAMRAMHEASVLESEEEVNAWREQGKAKGEGLKDETSNTRLFPLQPLADEALPRDTIEEVIVRRGSTREFSHAAISFAELSTMIDRATRGIDGDFLGPEEPPLNELYLIVNAVDGLPAGAYVFRHDQRALEILKAGEFRVEAGYLGLEQEIPADCSVNVYFLADLNRALTRFGNRGYRAAQLEAAIMGGKFYLAAYAQRLGASGLTFFDDDVTEFFSPDAAGKSVMFLIALGRSVKRADISAM